MVAIQDALDVLTLQVRDLEELSAIGALGRIATMRSCGGMGLDPGLTAQIDATLARLKQAQVDRLVVEMVLARHWVYPMPNIGIELAVRAYLTQMGIGYWVEEDGPFYQVGLRYQGRREEGRFGAAWYGLLLLSRRMI